MDLMDQYRTPLVNMRRLAKKIGLPELLLKLESVNPFSHTFKDRGALAAVQEAVRRRAPLILAATCGNMGVAVASVSAHCGLPSLILVSSEAPILTQRMIAAVATKVWVAEGRFDELNALVQRLTNADSEVACINTTLNDAFRRGFRSLMAELLAQLDPKGKYAVCVPTADGTLLAACFEEYVASRQGGASKLGPSIRFVMAQPSGCAPLVEAHLTGNGVRGWDGSASTEVLPLAVQAPLVHGPAALRSLKETEGTAIAVPEDDIRGYASLLAQFGGIFSDLVGGVLIGAISELARQKWLRKGEIPVGIYTGNGMIDSGSAPKTWVPTLASHLDVENDIYRELQARKAGKS